jgi:GAF domain-containing protein
LETDEDLFRRLEQLNEIGSALSQERNIDHLLEKILLAAKAITRAAGGTLYLLEPSHEGPRLRFAIMRNETLDIAMGGTTGNPIPFYPVHLYGKDGKANNQMVAAYAALTGKTVNIADAYSEEGFDFSGTRNFDKKTGYRSKAFLTVPMKNHEGETIGVLQLINRVGPTVLGPAPGGVARVPGRHCPHQSTPHQSARSIVRVLHCAHQHRDRREISVYGGPLSACPGAHDDAG